MTNEELNSRHDKVNARRDGLEKAVSGMQRSLYERILDRIQELYEKPALFEGIFKVFTKEDHAEVIEQFARDITYIGTINSDYFRELLDYSENVFAPISRAVGKTVLQRFGLTADGSLINGGYLDSFIQDTTVKRTIQQYMWKAKTSGVGLQEFRKGLKRLIVDNEDSVGLFKRYYQQYSLDTYNEADAVLQNEYAERLELEAFIYAGGVIRDSRPFCVARNGRVILKSEAKLWGTPKDPIEQYVDTEKHPSGGYSNRSAGEFQGKGKSYVWTSRGNFNCRHGLSFITNEMAMRRRDNLELDENGKLRVKS